MITDLLRASRPLSWINTAYPFAAAHLLATREIDAALVVGTVFFLVPYNLALYGVNDVFDYASDLSNPRKGGVEGALLPPRRHRTVLVASVLAGVPFLVPLVALGPPSSWVALTVSLFALVAYSAPPFRFKEIPFLDSLTSSVHFVSPAVYGLTLARAEFDPGTLAALGAFLLWGMASHAFGAVQDIVPDRAGAISSVATALGAARTVRFALVAWTAAGLLALTTTWPGPLTALLALPYLAAALPHARLDDAHSARANRGWRHFLWINYACGTALTMVLIWYVLRNGGMA
ncbi:prenyltransferase [Myceligenerans salitolerans]|uniref:Prenyltransferase n=1 Tax=Myceligenerans salitolerans TaxID=1230528 RepID=A0ABS3I5B9_9MICO|nr:prenyltransferase [Myceligenerans salitolerans]MBO0607816.1 prenyltransferase [Myceligenerans salitolerans]